MRKITLILFLLCYYPFAFAQVKDSVNIPIRDSVKTISDQLQLPTTTVEQQLENITESNEDMETEDDSYLQEMAQFQRNPLNLNNADEASLRELIILTPLQIQNLIAYRSVMGKLIDIYELQAVPGWNIRTIQR